MKLILLYVTFIAVISLTFACNHQENKDIEGNNLSPRKGPLSDCCGHCQSTPNCKAYSWNDWEGGTCWLKTSDGPVVDKPGVTIGTLGGGCQQQQGKDIHENNLAQRQGQASDCCGICQSTSGCQAYAWTDFEGGTCWLKSATGPVVDNANSVVGIIGSGSKSVPQGGSGSYKLKKAYEGHSFLDQFDFFTHDDPTHGFVDYVDRGKAQSLGLLGVEGNKIRISADSSNGVNGRGRPAVRLHSKENYNNGLFIFDLDHMPTGPGTWPAYWFVGGDWPNNGEIDVLEGVHGFNYNNIALHTNDGCVMPDDSSLFKGHWAKGENGQISKNCFVNTPGQYANQGCSIQTADGYFGPQFNRDGGGVFAFEWEREKHLKIWVFKRNEIPGDISQSNPQPKNWGKPYAHFTIGANCPADHFKNHIIVINLTFCGDWAGSVFPGGKGACENVVRNDPGAFKDAYWLINHIKVYGH